MHNLDTALTTNGVLFRERVALNALPFLNWVRFTLDAATEEAYMRIHHCHPSHFEKVVNDIAGAVGCILLRFFSFAQSCRGYTKCDPHCNHEATEVEKHLGKTKGKNGDSQEVLRVHGLAQVLG